MLRPTHPARCGGSLNRPPRHRPAGQRPPRHRPARQSPPEAAPGAGPAPHRDLFPDIEDGSPSWRTADAARASLAPGSAGYTSPANRGAGFRTGFWLAVSGCGLALGAYLMAPEIADIVPAAEAPMDRYVRAVDAGRSVLADTAERLLAQF